VEVRVEVEFEKIPEYNMFAELMRVLV